MLVAHLVPGYAAAAASRPHWSDEWSRAQRTVLWIAALSSTAAPDVDVILNILAGRGAYHSTLWTHSLFVHLGLALIWWLTLITRQSWYLQILTGLVAIGGLSHLMLDVIAHSTPLFYPFSMHMIGFAPARALRGGLHGYLTHPIALLEPVMIGLAAWHWRRGRYAAHGTPHAPRS